eukprot:scaffold36969_cov21-Tisochrysis_lutea.AAC.2
MGSVRPDPGSRAGPKPGAPDDHAAFIVHKLTSWLAAPTSVLSSHYVSSVCAMLSNDCVHAHAGDVCARSMRAMLSSDCVHVYVNNEKHGMMLTDGVRARLTSSTCTCHIVHTYAEQAEMFGTGVFPRPASLKLVPCIAVYFGGEVGSVDRSAYTYRTIVYLGQASLICVPT